MQRSADVKVDYPKALPPRAAIAGPAQDATRGSAFKIREQGAIGYHQARARKWAFPSQARASYAADSVAAAGLAWPSRILAARSEFLEPMKWVQALQGMREAWRSPRQRSTGSRRQKQSKTVYACRSPRCANHSLPRAYGNRRCQRRALTGNGLNGVNLDDQG